MRKYIAAGNWKLNKTIPETEEFLQQLKANVSGKSSCEIIIAPIYLSIAKAVEISNDSPIQISAQNCYNKNEGAFTGEISPSFLKAVGCTHVILGHSERRTILKETNQDICSKVQLTLTEGLTPIFCIGETLEEREANRVEAVLREQIQYGLQGIDLAGKDFIVAYEPVWAIGTGRVASKEDAQAAHAFIRKTMSEIFGDDIAQKTRILYGGSVKPGNVAELIAQPDIDGGLIGGASLKVETFTELIEMISKAG